METEIEQKTAKPKRKKTATYHDAAFAAFMYLLRKYIKNGDIVLENERHLSKRPLKIDIMIIKKNRDVEIETSFGKIFREHNVIEYKSPVDSALSLSVFNKVIHGYVGIYASQENIKLTDMTATIVCYNRPTELFNVLKNELNYKILRKAAGIYYILQKGAPLDKSLAVQIAVSSELSDSELVLKALRAKIDEETARKVIELPVEDEEYLISLSQWWEVMMLENNEIILLEANMNKVKRLVNFLEEHELLTDYAQRSKQEGMQQGMRQLLKFWESGHTLEEAKQKFSFA